MDNVNVDNMFFDDSLALREELDKQRFDNGGQKSARITIDDSGMFEKTHPNF